MNTIWALLIDISFSMNAGFSREKAPQGLVESVECQYKIEAAKELLIRQVKNLPSVELCIIAFDDKSEIIYQGPSENISEIQQRVNSLQPRGDTNIAKALDLAAKTISTVQYDSVSVLIISDGLSNQGDPVEAATNFIKRIPGSRISTILIDRTEEGEKIANNISIGGEVRDGTSYDKLRSGFKDEKINTLKDALSNLDFKRSSLEFALPKSLDFEPPAMIEFRGTDEVKFASDFMGSHVVPYLSSLEAIEKITQSIVGKSCNVKIHSISHYSPIKASVSGIAHALNILEEMIIPWKREYARTIANLKVDEIRINNEKAKAEALEIEARTQRENREAEKISQEARLTQAKVKQLESESEENKFRLKEVQAKLAINILKDLEENNISLSEASKVAYIHEIIGPIKFLMESPVEANVNRNYQSSEYEE